MGKMVILFFILLPILGSIIFQIFSYNKAKKYIETLNLLKYKDKILKDYVINGEFLLFIIIPILNYLIFVIIIKDFISEDIIKQEIDKNINNMINAEYDTFKSFYKKSNCNILSESEIINILHYSVNKNLLITVYLDLINLLNEYDKIKHLNLINNQNLPKSVINSINNFVKLCDKLQNLEDGDAIVDIYFNPYNELIENIIKDIDEKNAIFVNTNNNLNSFTKLSK